MVEVVDFLKVLVAPFEAQSIACSVIVTDEIVFVCCIAENGVQCVGGALSSRTWLLGQSVTVGDDLARIAIGFCQWISDERGMLQCLFEKRRRVRLHKAVIDEELAVGGDKRDDVLMRVPHNIGDVRVVIPTQCSVLHFSTDLDGYRTLRRSFAIWCPTIRPFDLYQQ